MVAVTNEIAVWDITSDGLEGGLPSRLQKAPQRGAGLRNMPNKFRSPLWGDVQGCFSTQLSTLVEW
ncbi:hypothetical protein FC066_06665 [Vibrio tasmaniensis]|nr:hypothetical protein FC066_06665 [Vibrio tasmaniensis]